MPIIILGQTVKDKITGLTGIVTGRVEYISGEINVLVQPRVKPDGESIKGEWLAENSVEVTSAAVLKLDE